MQEVIREMILDTGQKIMFKAGPIHPFWRIVFNDGVTPEALRGQYQDINDAIYAVEKYLSKRRNDRKATITKVKEKT